MGRRIAVIDIGSKSVKCFVGEERGDGTIQRLLDVNEIVALGEGLSRTGRISAAALERNAQTVTGFVNQARSLSAEQIIAVGTMALRSAENSADFIQRVKVLCGVGVRVLSGEEEARLSYLAVLTGLSRTRAETAVFDSGGGSTEFIFGRSGVPERSFSVNLGVNRITETFFQDDPVKSGSVEAALLQIDRELEKAGVSGTPERVIGIGGVVTGMGAVCHRMAEYDPEVIQGSVLTDKEVTEQLNTYSVLTNEQRCRIPGVQPGRADVMLAGACIVKTVLKRLGATRLVISDRGLRHGLAYELLFGSENNK